MEIFHWFSFSIGLVSPLSLLGSFQHLCVATHKYLSMVTFVHSTLKSAKKIHQNRLINLDVAMVHRLGDFDESPIKFISISSIHCDNQFVRSLN